MKHRRTTPPKKKKDITWGTPKDVQERERHRVKQPRLHKGSKHCRVTKGDHIFEPYREENYFKNTKFITSRCKCGKLKITFSKITTINHEEIKK